MLAGAEEGYLNYTQHIQHYSEEVISGIRLISHCIYDQVILSSYLPLNSPKSSLDIVIYLRRKNNEVLRNDWHGRNVS